MSDLTIKNVDSVIEALTNLVDEESIQNALGTCCALVERSAKQKAQAFKGTGRLSRSITSEVRGHTGIIYTPLEYAPYVEYGTGLFAEEGGRTDVPWHYKDDEGEWHSTSGMKPQPFMRPALDENREQILRILKGGLMDD